MVPAPRPVGYLKLALLVGGFDPFVHGAGEAGGFGRGEGAADPGAYGRGVEAREQAMAEGVSTSVPVSRCFGSVIAAPAGS